MLHCRNLDFLAGVIATGPHLRLAFTPPPVKVILGRVMNALWPSFTQPSGLEVAALSCDPAVVRAYVDDPLVHDRVSGRLYFGLTDAGQWALEHAAEFPLPLLLMHSSADRICSAEASQEFAAQVPGDCTLKIWEGLYHEMHNEPEKEEVIAFLVDWLEAHTSA